MNPELILPSALRIALEPGQHYSLNFQREVIDDIDFYSVGMHFGQFAGYSQVDDDNFQAIRDPLGIEKLFYTESDSGELFFSRQFAELYSHGSQIYSVPAGWLVNIARGGKREKIRAISPSLVSRASKPKPDAGIAADFSIDRFHAAQRHRLKTIFTAIRQLEDAGYTMFIALSGGLDSSIIATFAKQQLSHPIACTLDLGASEDSRQSEKIAAHIDIPHRIFKTEREQILQALDVAPGLCQDFRDFNVHCAAINILLAQHIHHYAERCEDIDADKIVVLTGDLMNEFCCDYAGEVIDGVEYYKLPRIGKKDLQTYLMRGLDSSDRELSVFRHFGIQCIQPYSALYDLYSSLPEEILSHDDPKKFLNSPLIDAEILEFIPKVKLRAQVGSRDHMGVLGICHQLGLGNRHFKQNLLEHCGYPDRTVPIFVGRYIEESL